MFESDLLDPEKAVGILDNMEQLLTEIKKLDDQLEPYQADYFFMAKSSS